MSFGHGSGPGQGLRVRSVQGRLSIEIGDEDEAGGEPVKAEPSARSSGFRRPAKTAGASRGQGRLQRRTASLRRSSTLWPIVAWSRTGPSSGANNGGGDANELEETGLSWRDAETQAFVELWHKLQHEGQASPCVLQ